MKIKLYDSLFAPVAPQLFEVDSLPLWLLAQYGEVPTVTVQIFRGEPCAENEITGNIAAIMASDADEYVVLQSPGGLEWYVIAIIVAVATVAVIALIPKPVMPGNVNRTQQSPNNALGSRENKVRMLERVEDIYGTVKSIPSLMMPTYAKYIGHKKFEYGYYCVGRGYNELAELRDGDTLISNIAGASAAVYWPFTSPNSGHAPVLQIGDAIIDDVLTASRAIEVDGLTLKALNQVQLPTSSTYTFTHDAGGDTITQASKQPNFNSVCAVGDVLVITMANYVVETGEWHDAAHNVVPEVGADHWHITSSTNYNYSGSYVVQSTTDGGIVLESTGWTTTLTSHPASVQITGASEYSDWVTLPDVDRTEVWANVVAANGMFKDSGGKSVATVGFTLEIEQLDSAFAPTGLVELVTGSLSGSATDERADTVEHATAWTGPCRVRMRRTTPYDYAWGGTVQDEIKWADLYSVSPVSKTEFGNKTTIHTITQATARATAVKSRQLNCLASRLIPTFDGSGFSGVLDSDGRHVSGVLSPSAKLVDIIAAVSVDPKIGARDLATEVDMAQIYGVQQQLDAWDMACGQFNYTFDSDNTSFEETLVTIANAGFCICYRQNGKIRLAFDRAQPVSTALFTHRNKKPNSESITRRFSSDAAHDGVEFVYVDPDSQQSETITLPLDGSYTKLKKFEIAGIRNFAQAWKRANREYKKLVGQRITIDTTTTLDARSLLPNTRVDIVDNTRFKSYDGEVIAQSGLVLTLSQVVVFAPGQPHSIVLMRRDGSLQSIAVTPGANSRQVVLQSLPAEAIVTAQGAEGIRTIYSFAADSARGAMAWLVQEIDVTDGQYCTIKAINYSDDYYSADSAAVPPRDAIIS